MTNANRMLVLMIASASGLCAQAVECSPYSLTNMWRLSILINDAVPSIPGVVKIDTVINNGATLDSGEYYTTTLNLGTTSTGDVLPGVTAREANASWAFSFGPAPRYAYTCSIAFKSYSLLESGGLPAGHRITRYAITVDALSGNIFGKVQYESHDLSGAVISVANGTFTGLPVGNQMDIASDPFYQ